MTYLLTLSTYNKPKGLAPLSLVIGAGGLVAGVSNADAAAYLLDLQGGWFEVGLQSRNDLSLA